MTIRQVGADAGIPEGAAGEWVLRSVEGDDAEDFVGRDFWMEIDGQSLRSATFCGDFWIDYDEDDGPWVSAAACLPPFDGADLNRLGRDHRTAVAGGANWEGEFLVFSGLGRTFTYERATTP